MPTARGGSTSSSAPSVRGRLRSSMSVQARAALAERHAQHREARPVDHHDIPRRQAAQRGVRSLRTPPPVAVRPATRALAGLGPQAPELLRRHRARSGASASRRASRSCWRSMRASSLTTALSAWNWANERFRRWCACVRRVPPHEVGRHVVGGPERRAERVGAARREGGHLLEGHEGRPEHDGVADLVDAPPPGPSGELRVLAGGQELVALAAELGEPLDHHGSGRHVHAEGERLGGEHGLGEPLDEAGLHRLLERRDHPGVVGGDPHLEPGEEAVEPEHVEVGVGERRGRARRRWHGSGRARPGVVSRRPASRQASRASSHALRLKMKVMAGSIDVVLQPLDHLDAPRGEEAPPRPTARRSRAAWSASSSRRSASGLGRPSTSVGRRWRSWELLSPTQVEVLQLDRSPLLDHRLRGAADRGDPVGQLLGVRHGGRQADERDVGRAGGS